MEESSSPEVLTIGFAGLATSHPYADAATVLARRPNARLHVWEEEADRLEDFLRRFPASVVHRDFASLTEVALDGVIVTLRPPDVAGAVSALAASAVPLFVNKPAAATLDQLAALDPVIRPISERVLTSSVLRFASPFREIRGLLDLDTVLAARATVRHDVGRWLHGSTPWQDDVLIGGGAIVTIGIHGIELLVSLLGPQVEVVSSLSGIRQLDGLRSEDVAVIGLRWANGVLGSVDLVGVAAGESYSVTLETVHGPITVDLPTSGGDPLGYEATVESFLGMVDDSRAGRAVRSPVEWDETYAILRAVATAAQLAHPTV